MVQERKRAGWFGPKRFGVGVGPRSWQGWLVMAGFAGACCGAGAAFEGAAFYLAVLALVAVLLAVMRATYAN